MMMLRRVVPSEGTVGRNREERQAHEDMGTVQPVRPKNTEANAPSPRLNPTWRTR